MIVSQSFRSSLADKIAPYVRDVSESARGASRSHGLVEFVAAVAPHPIQFVTRWWAMRPTSTRKRVDDEIATFLDRSAVSLAAGVTIHAMWERLGRDAVGILGDESGLIAREVSAGVPLTDAYNASEARLSHEGWSRFLGQLSASRRHGTPIAEIVRALAVEERAAAGRRLIELASARETLMLLPLVFVILPMTVLVAVFPGLVALGSLPM